VRAGRVVSGASTITQQLARRLRPRGAGLLGKLGEAWTALRLEAHLDKATILRAYCDRVPLGRNTTGVEAAAAAYFGTRAALLTTAQAALLAGVAHAPAREDPAVDAKAALARRDDVLRRMRRAGFLDDDALDAALREPLEPRVDVDTTVLAPHVVARLRDEWKGNASVDTTIDAGLQRAVEAIVRDEVGQGPYHERGLEHAAVIVLDNDSGDVLAWVGSADFFDDATLGKNDGVRARRQPGSALKPFVYGRALASGMTAATILPDVDTALSIGEGDVFLPQNYDRRMHGPVTVRLALQNSYNVPAIGVARTLGADAVLAALRDAGFTSLDQAAAHYGIGLVLGNGEVSLEELARAYRGLALGGVRKDHHLVRRVTAADGVVSDGASASNARDGERFLPEDVVALLTDILSDGAARTPAFGADNALDLPFPVAAKTGTSHAWVDNWTAGFTAERTVAVWAGAFDGTPMRGVSGVAGAGAIFRRVMLAAMKGITPAALVDDRRFVHARICPQSGLLAGPACPAFDEVFLPGTAPTAACDVHGDVHGDRDAASISTSTAHDVDGCASGERALRLGGALDDWAARDGRCRAPVEHRAAALLAPRDGDVYVLEPGVPIEGQEIALRTRGPVVAVDVDGAARAPTSTMWLPLLRGSHAVVVRFADGHEERARFTVE
jgi:penicillin-binding protein 1C